MIYILGHKPGTIGEGKIKLSSKVVNLYRWRVEPRSVMPLAAVLELGMGSSELYWEEVLPEIAALGTQRCIIKPQVASRYASNVAAICADRGLSVSLLLTMKSLEEGDKDFFSLILGKSAEVVFDIDLSQVGPLCARLSEADLKRPWSVRLTWGRRACQDQIDDIIRMIGYRPKRLDISGKMHEQRWLDAKTLLSLMDACKSSGTHTNMADYYNYLELDDHDKNRLCRCFVPWWLIVIDDMGMVRNCLVKSSPAVKLKPGRLKSIWSGTVLDRFRAEAETKAHRNSCACGIDLEIENLFLEMMHDDQR